MRVLLILLIITAIGCKKDQEESLVTLYIPNAFYPESTTASMNGDPAGNREFKVAVQSTTLQYLKTLDVWVYTSSGTEVFHSTDRNEGWDGTYKNKPMPVSSYTYSVRYTDTQNHTAYKQGSLMLVR